MPFYRPHTAFFDEESRLSSLLLLEARLSCVPFAVVSIEIYEMVSTGRSLIKMKVSFQSTLKLHHHMLQFQGTLILEGGDGKLYPIEMKLNSKVSKYDGRGLKRNPAL